MNIRLENIHTLVLPGNYVSFRGAAPNPRGRPDSDAGSVHSVSSVRSVISVISSFWSRIAAPSDVKHFSRQLAQDHDDLRYLYSSFTKLPSLCLGPDRRSKPVAGYEEFPFDTAVPLFAFKNLGVLEITGLDFRQFCGWDRLAEQLRSLTVRGGSVVDVADLLVAIVLDDTDKRRRRSSKQQLQTISSPLTSCSSHSPSFRNLDHGLFTPELPTSPFLELRRPSIDSSSVLTMVRTDSSMSRRDKGSYYSHRSSVPSSPVPGVRQSTPDPSPVYNCSDTPRLRRASVSDKSSMRSTPRNSSLCLPLPAILPQNKWRFLRHLALPDNDLTQLSTIGLAPLSDSLHSLDLTNNAFEEIPESIATLSSLQALNMSRCRITDLRSLMRHPLPNLSVINLSSNQLSSLAGIENILSVERIDLRDNHLTDPMEIARLTHAPNVLQIYVAKNPMVRIHSSYRIQIFNLFRATAGYTHDILLDRAGPSHSEKKYLQERVLCQAQPPIPAGEGISPQQPIGSAADSGTASVDHPSLEQRTLPKTAQRRMIKLSTNATTDESLPRDVVPASSKRHSAFELQLPHAPSLDEGVYVSRHVFSRDTGPVPCTETSGVDMGSSIGKTSGPISVDNDVKFLQAFDSGASIGNSWLSGPTHDGYDHLSGGMYATCGQAQAVSGVH